MNDEFQMPDGFLAEEDEEVTDPLEEGVAEDDEEEEAGATPAAEDEEDF